MKILTYLEAHEQIQLVADQLKLSLTESNRSRVIKLSGHLDTWIPALTQLIARSPRVTSAQALSHLEQANLLQPVFDTIPSSQHLFLLSPTSAPASSWLVTSGFIYQHQLFSPIFTLWIYQQPILESHLLVRSTLTSSESKLASALFARKNNLVSRDELAQTLWGDNWYDQYSDWTLDTTIHNLRGKLLSHWSLTTVRNRGYILALKTSAARRPRSVPPVAAPQGITPTDSYLDYMNNPYNPRKVYADLFDSLKNEKITLASLLPSSRPTILCINSYSFDNVDALAKYYPRAQVFWTNFDDRALKIHDARIEELSLDTYQTLYDDIRVTRLQPGTFDLVINDFRLNWNASHQENVLATQNMFRLLQDRGVVLISVVVDARYESDKYGDDQQKAPLNLNKPWTFRAQERLDRHCHTVPYYKKLFTDAGFTIKHEFDIAEGKRWSTGLVDVDPTTRPSFRRFLLIKS